MYGFYGYPSNGRHMQEPRRRLDFSAPPVAVPPPPVSTAEVSLAARLAEQIRHENMHRLELQEALLAAWRLEQRDAAYIDDVKRLELHGKPETITLTRKQQPGIRQFLVQ